MLHGIANTYKLEAIVLVLLGIIFLWDIGIYPAWFDHVVAQSIWPEVNQILDGTPHPLQGINRWQWQDMYQHNAGLSPLYGFLIGSGIQLGGLTLLAIRLPQALLTILVCCFAYTILRNRLGQSLILVFAIMLGTSPWFLLMMRSGGIIGFSCLLLIFSLSLISLIYPRNQPQSAPSFSPSLLIAFIAGFSVSLLPYGHSSVRLIALLLTICVPASYRIIGWKTALSFIAGCIPLLLLQLSNPSQAARVYFFVRGEGLLHVAAEQGNVEQVLAFISTKLSENVWLLFKLLFGLNDSVNWLNSNIADSYWRSDVVLYPKFLIPFLLLGLLFSAKTAIKNRCTGYILLLTGLFLSTAPSLMSGIGVPNQARLFISIIPIYLIISIAVCIIQSKVMLVSPLLSRFFIATLVFGTAIYQVINFFSFEKGAIDEKSTYQQLIDSYFETRQKCPESIIILHEFPEFSNYSYVTIRWRGGEALQNELNNHTTWLLNSNNSKAIENTINHSKSIAVITQKASFENAQQLLGKSMPPLVNASSEQVQIHSKDCQP